MSTFSYAQAAKGLSTPVASIKATSGSVTPAKDAGSTPAPASAGSVRSWADDTEPAAVIEQSRTANGDLPQVSTKPVQSAQPVETASISSPDLGASSASTVTKDDDVSSLPNASSESTWDNKSQASTSVDKSAEPVEKTSEKVKQGKNTVVKPLQEAPPPAVNIWKQRAEEQLKTKVHKPAAPVVNGASHGSSTRRGDLEGKGRSSANDSKLKGQDEEMHPHGPKEASSEANSKKSKPSEKDAKAAANALPPPPNRDQESWPTPETAIDEDRKKAQEKGDKGDKDRKESTSSASHGKHEWVKVPYTPSVVFNTPLPNAANARRGGRPGGRGGSQNAGRPAGFGANGAGQLEKEASPSANDEQKRDRAEGGGLRDASPRAKRTVGAASPVLKDAAAAMVSEKTNAGHESFEHLPEARATKASPATDSNAFSSQTGNHPRQYPRPNKPRRGDFAGTGERRQNGENSPTKDSTFDDRRATASTQTDASGADGERRSSHFHDAPNGHHKQGRFGGSYPGARDRPRGGARGGRANYSNGNQYPNGNMAPLNNSGSLSLGPRSPTTFNPENPSFFSSSQGKYARNAHRSQSVATDPFRFGPYQNGPQLPPLQTYNMYDYNMMQHPMSAVSYSQYVDSYALFALITTQVEYYFSVDNLLKDMYLRRHMDSQGFVTLEFIAGFNRIKSLSTDIELVKLVCQQSGVVEYRTGEDGQDRLRRREGWEQWVLSMADRHETAQNEGPKELRHPPMPHVNGFDQSNTPQWTMSAVAAPYSTEGPYPQINGYGHVTSQDMTFPTESFPNGTTAEGQKDDAIPNGHPIEHSA